MLKEVYPDFDWFPWKFSSTPANFLLSSDKNKKLFMDWAGNQLEIKQLSDWYNVNLKVYYIVDIHRNNHIIF